MKPEQRSVSTEAAREPAPSLVARLRQKRRAVAKRTRLLTSQWRPLPDFLIIGVQKGGTTALFHYLSQHRRVMPSVRKEVHYFDLQYGRGLDYYRSYFGIRWPQRLTRGPVLVGEASPSYIFHPAGAERIARHLPDARLIVLLRNPVDRALSHYRHNLVAQDGREALTLDEALAAETDRLSGVVSRLLEGDRDACITYMRYSYRTRGIYVEQMQRLFEHFPREQILILKSEDMFADTRAIYRQTLDFLGLPVQELASYQPVMETTQMARQFSIDLPRMSEATRQALSAFYQPYNEQLYALLGHDFAWC